MPGIYNFNETVTHVFMWQGYLVFSTEQIALAYLLEEAIKKFQCFEATSLRDTKQETIDGND